MREKNFVYIVYTQTTRDYFGFALLADVSFRLKIIRILYFIPRRLLILDISDGWHGNRKRTTLIHNNRQKNLIRLILCIAPFFVAKCDPFVRTKSRKMANAHHRSIERRSKVSTPSRLCAEHTEKRRGNTYKV